MRDFEDCQMPSHSRVPLARGRRITISSIIEDAYGESPPPSGDHRIAARSARLRPIFASGGTPERLQKVPYHIGGIARTVRIGNFVWIVLYFTK